MPGRPAARLTDMHVCPAETGPVPHVGGPVLGPGAPTVLIGGLPAARVGDILTCVGPPDVIVSGSSGVFIGGQPAARMGDQTAHGGVIVVGDPTVLIGETGSGVGDGGGAGGGGGNLLEIIVNFLLGAPPTAALPKLTRDQVTWRLQRMTTAAAKKVDAKGMDAFSPAQQRAIQNHPNLRAPYRGSEIDKEVRLNVKSDPLLNDRLTGAPNKGVDFTDNLTGQKYDMTTFQQTESHLQKYGPDTIILNTNGDEPIMPEGISVPPEIPTATIPETLPVVPEPLVLPVPPELIVPGLITEIPIP